LYGAKTRDTDQKYIESFEIWCWRMEKISWTYCAKNEEVQQRVKEERKILHGIKRRNVKWIGHIRHRTAF